MDDYDVLTRSPEEMSIGDLYAVIRMLRENLYDVMKRTDESLRCHRTARDEVEIPYQIQMERLRQQGQKRLI